MHYLWQPYFKVKSNSIKCTDVSRQAAEIKTENIQDLSFPHAILYCLFSHILHFYSFRLLKQTESIPMWAQGCLPCMAWWSLLKPHSVEELFWDFFFFFLGKCTKPFLVFPLSCLEGLQINRRGKEKETKIIVDFSCEKFQHIAVNLLTPKSTCLLGLSSYMASLH